MPNAIKFLQDSHRYITEDGCDLTSVSKFTETFVPYVDWKEIARKSAAKKTKEGIPTTQAEMLKKWEHKRVTSARVGTLLHSILENEEKDVITCPVIEGIKTSISINDIENGRTYTELMIYDFDHMICGQSDKVEIRDGKINIVDYKTDAKIEFKAFSSKWVKPRKLLSPIAHLDDSRGNIYSIKMSLYMYMLWKANNGRFKPGKLILEHIHLKRDEEGIPILENDLPVIIGRETLILPYRKKEVVDMLKTLEK
jgi:hypothetical protein